MTRERLVAASYEVFARSGYTATAIQDITDAADVNRSTFYQNFAGKPEIFLATAEYRIGLTALRCWKTLDAALTTGTRAAIRTWLLEAARWWSDNAAFVAASTEATSVEPTLRASQSVLYDRIGDSLTEYRMSLPQGPERERGVLLVEMLLIQLNGVFTQYLGPETSPGKSADVLDLLADIWCTTLQIPAD